MTYSAGRGDSAQGRGGQPAGRAPQTSGRATQSRTSVPTRGGQVAAHPPAGSGRRHGDRDRDRNRGHGGLGPEDARRAELYSQVRLRSPDGPLRARLDPLQDLPAQRRDDRTAMGLPPRGLLGRFVADLGWRAYAVPLLIIATLVVLADLAKGGTSSTGDGGGNTLSSPSYGGPPPPAPKASIWVDAPPDPNANLPSSALPNGGPYDQKGNGEFDIVPGTSQVYGTSGPLKLFTVEVEQGITNIDQAGFAAEVEKILGDSRGWSHGGRLRFQRVDSGTPDFRVTLTTPDTVRGLCGYDIKAETSCYNRTIRRVVINVARWVRGAVAYGSKMQEYHEYAITHETGHALGHGHEACPANGALAPPMMQQTLGVTSSDGKTCKPNPWPFPNGDKEVTGPPTDEPPKMN